MDLSLGMLQNLGNFLWGSGMDNFTVLQHIWEQASVRELGQFVG